MEYCDTAQMWKYSFFGTVRAVCRSLFGVMQQGILVLSVPILPPAIVNETVLVNMLS